MLRLTGPQGPRVVEAVVSRRAAALRALRVDGVDLVEPTTGCAGTPGMAGVILAPWPNRVERARWLLDGAEQRLPVNEPDLGNANHGLLSTTDFAVVRHDGAAVTLGADIASPPGYPFDLRVEVTHTLLGNGARTRVVVTNVGARPAPVAVGGHPYLRVGEVPTARLRVTLDADHRWPLDERHLPGRRRRLLAPVRDAPLADLPGHATFERTRPARLIRHEITAPDGQTTRLTALPACRFTQLWVATDLPTDEGPRQAVAIEPMTAPPNALRLGTGLRWVAAGGRWSTGWVVGLVA